MYLTLLASDEGCGSGQVFYVDWSVVLLCKSCVCVLVPLKYFDKSLSGALTVDCREERPSGVRTCGASQVVDSGQGGSLSAHSPEPVSTFFAPVKVDQTLLELGQTWS